MQSVSSRRNGSMSVTKPTAWKAPAIGQLRDDPGIDIDAKCFHGRGQQISDRDRVQHRAHHHRDRDPFEFGPHRFLRLDRVGDDVGQRPVIADGTGEDKIDVVFHAGVHDAALEQTARDGLPDPAGSANGVDRAHMILRALVGERAVLEIHA